MAFVAPLDLENIFVNTLAGTPTIFTFLAFILLSGMAAYFKMPNAIFLVMFVLFGVVFSSYVGGIYILILLLSGLSTFYLISKIIKG